MMLKRERKPNQKIKEEEKKAKHLVRKDFKKKGKTKREVCKKKRNAVINLRKARGIFKKKKKKRFAFGNKYIAICFLFWSKHKKE